VFFSEHSVHSSRSPTVITTSQHDYTTWSLLRLHVGLQGGPN